ncbi:MAG: GNAT family N-acetyltransferase [Burkholderiales bacterium]|nr:GNAT family N-acetyltransferase [Burkholderiales bacterium]
MINKSKYDKGVQQQNFKEIIQAMLSIDGWNILNDKDLLALIAPSSVNFVNFTWGKPSPSNIEKVKSFYKHADFTWLTSGNDIDGLIQEGFVLDESVSTEMILDFNKYVIPEFSTSIKIITTKSDTELYVWTETAIKTFGCSHYEFKEFFHPLISFAHCVPFLLTYDNQPAGTAMVYCGQNTAGIYAMSTIEKYRGKGCATAAVNACISLAQSKNLHHAVLYASAVGKPLYTKLGFEEVDTLQEWHLEKHLAKI